MSFPRFKVRRQFNPRGKWTALPQAGLRVWLTCPRCRHEYRLVHDFCGIAIDVKEALVLRECSVCKENGQDYRILEGIADCPSCGLECRGLTQVEDEYQSSSTPRDINKVKPIKGSCFVCGNPALEKHHADWNHANNSPENLRLVCEWCHLQAHKLGKPLFEQLVDRVRKDPKEITGLRQASQEWHGKLHGQ